MTPTPDRLREQLEATLAWREASAGADAIAGGLATARDAPASLVDRLRWADRIVVTGAGSSLYVAQIAAAALREACRLPAVAVPLSEVLLRPDGVLAPVTPATQPVLVVSRSGTTTEAVRVVRRLSDAGHHTVAVTGHADSPMATAADHVLEVPLAAEEAIVMTRSFAGLTAALLRLAARSAPDPTFAAELDELPALWGSVAGAVAEGVAHAAADPSRVVVLGGGAAMGLANEAVLKLTETSQVPANAWEPWEFRHGPISVCEPGMLVVGIVGGPHADVEGRVVSEAGALGATAWVPALDGPGASLGPIARLPLLLHPLQALALTLAIRRGRDPEHPRHLRQVVVLDGA